MRKLGYILFVMIILVMSWETSIEAQNLIPEDSIRLRILANSDSLQDQWIKRKVRDAIIAEVNSWVDSLQVKDLAEARQLIKSRMPEIEEAVQSTLTQYGFTYGFKMELDVVPFPTKVYAGEVYPAGDYEALRVTLGKGEGQNWWCVLFPPLCFVDITTDEYDYPQKSQPVVDNRVENDTSKKTKQDVEDHKVNKKQTNKAKVKTSFYFLEVWNSWF
jgi:stage II sporulation protein R